MLTKLTKPKQTLPSLRRQPLLLQIPEATSVGAGWGVTLLQDAQQAAEALLHLVKPRMALLLCLQESNSRAWGGAGSCTVQGDQIVTVEGTPPLRHRWG